MPEPGWRDASLLLDMKLSAQDAMEFVAGLDEAAFMASSLHQHAVIRALEIVGEAAGKVSAELRNGHPEIPWVAIIGMRHRLIHGYADVDMAQVWSVTQQDLQPLIAVLEPIIPGPPPT